MIRDVHPSCCLPDVAKRARLCVPWWLPGASAVAAILMGFVCLLASVVRPRLVILLVSPLGLDLASDGWAQWVSSALVRLLRRLTLRLLGLFASHLP